MVRRFGMLAAALFGFAACSGGGGSTPSASPTSAGASKAALAVSLGTEEALSSGYSYELVVTLTTASGQVVGGTYPTPVTLTTSDSTDTGFSSTAAGENVSPSVTITSSTQPVFLVYDGAKLSSAVTLTAAATNYPSAQYSFAASGSGNATTTTTTTTVASVSIAPNGTLPQAGVAGSFTLTVAGYSASGSLISGNYANPIVLTSNDTADLTFSVNGAAATSSASVPSSGAIVVVDYDGATVPATTTISASASGAQTVSIPFSPSTASTTSATAIGSLSLSQIGATPNQGTPGQFALTITASSTGGTAISGQYPASVIVTTNDSSVLGLSTSSGGPFTPSVSVSNSSAIVYVQYSGGTVPQSTEFAANAGSVQGVLPFNPEANAKQALYIQTLYVSTSGASPTTNAYGSQPIYITAFDQNGNTISGTYPSPIDVTINNATELDLSLGSYSAAVDCTQPGENPCPNNAASVVNGSGQVIFGDYAPLYSTYPSQISVSTTGIQCAAINFPLAVGSSTSQSPSPAPAQTGSTPYSCQIANPAPTPSPDAGATSAATHRGSHWQLIPIGRR